MSLQRAPARREAPISKAAPARAGAAYLRTQFLGLLLVFMGAVLVALGTPGAGIASMVFGACFAGLGLSQWLLAPGAQAVQTSLNLIGLGRLAEAEKILDAAEKRFLGRHRTSLLQQRALIALRRGDKEAALTHADASVRQPLGVNRTFAALQHTNALAIRALVRASLGDAVGARADIDAVRATRGALIQPLGRAALAEAMLLERAGDRAALRELLQHRADVLLEGTGPRERAIVRAYQRMVKVTATTPYRQSAQREDAAAEEPALVDWVAKVAPGAAAFVRAPAPSTGGAPVPAASVTAEARRAVEEARRKGHPTVRARRVRDVAVRLGGLAVLSGAVFAVVFTALGSGEPHAGAAGSGASPLGSTLDGLSRVLISIVLGGAGVLVGMVAQARRQNQRLVEAVSMLVTQPERAMDELRALTGSRYGLVRAQAHLYLAAIAERRGDTAGLLSECECGLGEVAAPALRAVAAEIVTPGLAAQRAFGLSATDRFDEAHAEIASLPAHFPLRGLARFRVRLLSLVRQGDLQAALRFVEQEMHDLPLSPRDELLADAVRVTVAPHTCGAAEVLRVKEDLRVASYRRWITAVAPGLLTAVEHVPEDEAEGEARDEAEAQREEAAAAEAEAVERERRALRA